MKLLPLQELRKEPRQADGCECDGNGGERDLPTEHARQPDLLGIWRQQNPFVRRATGEGAEYRGFRQSVRDTSLGFGLSPRPPYGKRRWMLTDSNA
jgi:hypothetical protein